MHSCCMHPCASSPLISIGTRSCMGNGRCVLIWHVGVFGNLYTPVCYLIETVTVPLQPCAPIEMNGTLTQGCMQQLWIPMSVKEDPAWEVHVCVHVWMGSKSKCWSSCINPISLKPSLIFSLFFLPVTSFLCIGWVALYVYLHQTESWECMELWYMTI